MTVRCHFIIGINEKTGDANRRLNLPGVHYRRFNVAKESHPRARQTDWRRQLCTEF